MVKIWSMTVSISWNGVGGGRVGAALRGRTIKFITTKTLNPYRIEPRMRLRRKRGIRSTLKIKTAAM